MKRKSLCQIQAGDHSNESGNEEVCSALECYELRSVGSLHCKRHIKICNPLYGKYKKEQTKIEKYFGRDLSGLSNERLLGIIATCDRVGAMRKEYQTISFKPEDRDAGHTGMLSKIQRLSKRATKQIIQNEIACEVEGSTDNLANINKDNARVSTAEDSSSSSSDQTPSSSDHTPSSSDHTPSSSDHTPSSSDHTPSSSDHTPSSSDHTPSSSTDANQEHSYEVITKTPLRVHNSKRKLAEIPPNDFLDAYHKEAMRQRRELRSSVKSSLNRIISKINKLIKRPITMKSKEVFLLLMSPCILCKSPQSSWPNARRISNMGNRAHIIVVNWTKQKQTIDECIDKNAKLYSDGIIPMEKEDIVIKLISKLVEISMSHDVFLYSLAIKGSMLSTKYLDIKTTNFFNINEKSNFIDVTSCDCNGEMAFIIDKFGVEVS